MRVLLSEPPHEVVLRAVLQVHHVAANELRAVLRDRLDRALDEGRLRGDAGHDGVHQHPGPDAGVHQRADGAKPLQWMRRAWLERSPHVLVHARHADADRALSAARQVSEDVLVAHDHRSLGDDARRIAEVAERLKRLPCQLVVALDGLIAVRGGAQRDELPAPRWLAQLSTQDIHDIRLDEDDGGELVVCIRARTGRGSGARSSSGTRACSHDTD